MNRTQVIESVVAKQLKDPKGLPLLTIGDTIDVHYKIVEGDKERTQIFQGVLISMKGRGINAVITVRRIVANEGVERIFPVHSPRLIKIEVVRRADARRSKLYYLRDRTGRSRRLRDQRRGLKHFEAEMIGGSEGAEGGEKSAKAPKAAKPKAEKKAKAAKA
ncbi:MAG: 50S ribosomal protein L19 [Phycisphaeraceae bacterium]|nr:50S ribosomal protein L19 [Phycisphaeraceae bacterium]